jgi:aspartyl-tRNA(Asn)/glutamyl-tRNA(Gln) amidotransferase subunit A
LAQYADLPRSLAGLSRELLARHLSPVEVVRALLGRIEADETNSFITVTAEWALEKATLAEREILAGRHRGPLHGVPVALKDIIYTRGVRTTMGSALYAWHVPDHSATAVAANLCYGALGSDTGGSIRIPAALCGTVGMKPTFGRVSKGGVFPLSWSLDHVGPITRTVEDNALMLNVLTGHDPEDPYSVDHPAEDFARDLQRGLRGAGIGLPTSFYFDHVDEEVGALVREAMEVFRSLGAQVREVEIPNLVDTLHAQRLILGAEAYAVHEERLENEPEAFDEEVCERLMDGARPRAYRYANARRRGVLATDEFDHALQGVDVLLTPTLPIVATEIGQREVRIGDNKESVRSALTRYTGPTDLTGHPSLSIPCGTIASGLPVGLQLIGRHFDEAILYRFGHAYEEAMIQDQQPAVR